MTFPIIPSNSPSGIYAIDNSLRFNDGDSAYLSRTPASTGNRRTWTWSGWVKRSVISQSGTALFTAYNTGSDTGLCEFYFASDTLRLQFWTSGVYTSAKFRDTSAWYHVVVAVDTTQATGTDRVKMYVNGVEQSLTFGYTPSLNLDTAVNNTVGHSVGSGQTYTSHYFDGYIAEVNFIDGQALSPTDFGEFDSDSGIWKPIQYTGSYGTNGFYLDFENSGSLGADQSGNGNNFTPTNLASTDQTTDTPTNNFATWNVLMNNNPAITTGDSTFIEGNTEAQFNSASQNGNIVGTIGGLNTGKFYWENKVVAVGGDFGVGIANEEINYNTSSSWNTGNSVLYLSSGNKRQGSSSSAYGASYTTGDIIGVALDLDANTITFYKNGSSQGSISVVSGYRYNIVAYGYNSAKCSVNFGNPSFSISSGNTDDNGYGNFEYAPPSGYLALCTQNLATALSPTIDDGSAYFHTQLYTGDGTTGRSITNDANAGNFQPDWLWIKERSSTSSHRLTDSSRGVNKVLITSGTNEELTRDEIGSYDTDGFTIDGTVDTVLSVNENSVTYVAWQWLANGGTTSSNTDGSITSTVQANTTAGFSIVTYTGNGSTGTVGHGLGAVPKLYIVKRRNDSGWSWYTYSVHKGAGYTLYLNSTSAGDSDTTVWQNTSPTSSVFYVGARDGVNGSGGNMVAYCFAEIEGYSKFGSYTGNGSTDGTFVYTGFRPAFVLIKRTTGTEDWIIYDSVRDTFNAVDSFLKPNISDAEGTASYGDLLSNGFKARNTFAPLNASGEPHIYIAFAENPFVSSTGIPVTAR